VIDGGASGETTPFLRTSAEKIATAIPEAWRRTIEDQGHNFSPEAIAPLLVAFLSERYSGRS
jgi:hypothetical protein